MAGDQSTGATCITGCKTTLSEMCPSGKQVIGGGYSNAYSGDVIVTGSYPVDPSLSSSATGSGWQVSVVNNDAVARTVHLYAICANPSSSS